MKLLHLTDIKQLDQKTILAILDSATQMLNDLVLKDKTSTIAEGKLVANLFFEPSTRTCNSFEIAAKRLGALTISPNMQSSSLLKGETLLDTIQSIEAMGVNAFVIRHSEHGIMSAISNSLKTKAHIINAGEGWQQHPTQALLDLLTIQQHKSDWKNISVAIVGDLYHSRVSRSLVEALHIVGVKDLRLIAPEVLKPEADICSKAKLYTPDLAQGLNNVDVVVCLRLQKERMSKEQSISETKFSQLYQISENALKHAKPDAIVMHPGPMNRGVEISSEVADGNQSVILQQVQNGVAIRMAILKALL